MQVKVVMGDAVVREGSKGGRRCSDMMERAGLRSDGVRERFPRLRVCFYNAELVCFYSCFSFCQETSRQGGAKYWKHGVHCQAFSCSQMSKKMSLSQLVIVSCRSQTAMHCNHILTAD